MGGFTALVQVYGGSPPNGFRARVAACRCDRYLHPHRLDRLLEIQGIHERFGVFLGNRTITTWSATHPSVSLSSGETELNGAVRGAGVGLGLQSLL